MNSSKAYKIINKKTNKPISLGYSSKASWKVWPSEAIKSLKNPEDYFVQEYELVESKKFDLKRNQL